jgi:N-acetylmuramoyl-L-alanine amidase
MKKTLLLTLLLMIGFTIGTASANRLNTSASRLEIMVKFAEDRQGFSVTGRRLLSGSEVLYLSSHDVGAIFRGGRFWNDQTRSLTFRIRDHEFTLTAGARLIGHNDEQILLRTPPLAIDGDLWLPLEFLQRIVGPAVSEIVSWDPSAPALQVGSKLANVTSVRLSTGTRSTTMSVRCDQALGYRVTVPRHRLLVLKIYDGVLGPNVSAALNGRGLIRGIRARQYSDHAVLEIEVSSLVSEYEIDRGENGRDLRLVLEEEATGAIPQPELRGQLNMAEPELLRAAGELLPVRVVVIDPGHGGRQPGKIGTRGTREKDINLHLAKALRDELKDAGLMVVMTRDKDKYVELDDRAEIANKAGGDLFVSLHCNGWFNDTANGVETYFLSASDRNTPSGDTDFVDWTQIQQKHLGRSSDLAETIQAGMISDLSMVDRGVKQAAFQVLRGCDMPAVLVETGFLSHDREESQLRDPQHRRRVARSIARAILEFRERYANPAGEADHE